MEATMTETFKQVADILLGVKYSELESLQAERTELRRNIPAALRLGGSKELDNIAEDIAECRKVIRGLWKVSNS